ncbi:MAG TPA: VOC family protein [Edaphobacter sp.]|nr:VOC family protein [Edaphobacter sp.]
MHVHPYLNFNGNCEKAFKFYENCLGAKILMMMPHTGSPIEKMVPPEWGDKILHASLKIGDTMLFASDAPSNRYNKPTGFFVSLQIENTDEAERIFSELSMGGQVHMDLQETFWALRFAMFNDRFGTPWMINCEKPMP